MSEKTKIDQEELENVYVHKFEKPFKYEGKEYTTLNFYFGRLTGRDMIDAENEMMAMGEYAITPEISTSYLAKIAAKAAGVSSDLIENLPINEFNAIRAKARDFLTSRA